MRHTLLLIASLIGTVVVPSAAFAAGYEGFWSTDRRDCAGSRNFLESSRTLIVEGSSLRAKGWACELMTVIGTSRSEIDVSCTGASNREYRRVLKLDGRRSTLVIAGLPGGDLVYQRCGRRPVAERARGSRATAVRYENEGERLLSLGDYHSAEKLFTKSIGADASYDSAFNNRGFAKRLQNRNAEAVEDYDEAIRLDPGSAIYYSNRGVAKDALGNLKMALPDFDRALEIDPSAPTALNGRGSILRQLGKVDRAIIDLEKAVRINPRYVVCLNNLALAYRDKGDRVRAIKLFERALTIEPTNAFALREKASI